MTSTKSNFHRTQSKVWWGSMNEHDPYRFLTLPASSKSSRSPKIDHLDNSSDSGHNIWDQRRASPGSLKSQDSGFADSDHSPNFSTKQSASAQSSPSKEPNKNILKSTPDKLTPKKNVNYEINTQINQRSPSICSDRETPPTVIRKKLNTELRCTPRKISFSEPNSPTNGDRSLSPDLQNKIDSLSYNNTSPLCSPIKLESPRSIFSFKRDRSIKRGIRVSRSRKILQKFMEPSSPGAKSETNSIPEELEQNDQVSSPQPYKNETVYFGTGGDDNNNIFDKSIKSQQLPTYAELYPSGTSTPKNSENTNRSRQQPGGFSLIRPDPRKLLESLDDVIDLSATMNWDTLTYIEYTNPALNGHAPSVHFWLDETRTSYCHEVLSTLQTKSVAQAASRNLNVCSVTSGKIVRQLQHKVIQLQNHFECVEKLINANDHNQFDKKIPSKIIGLFEATIEFVNKIRKRHIFRSETDHDVKKFDDNMNSIVDLAMDLHKNVTSQPIDIEPKELLEDILIIKRYLLITLQMIFEKLIKIIVDRIEETKCDLILKSNLTMIAMLSNIEYGGFASLNDAFRATGIIKVLLTMCIDSSSSSIRTLALRALATICSTKELIRQFEQAEGIEILRDILNGSYYNIIRTDSEYREAISVLTQITAPWHGRLNTIDGIRHYIESIVESVTKIIDRTTCCQTLLLCVACLNNLSKMEITTTYSMMSNETIVKLKKACERRGPEASIFLYEQISSILLNMAAIKKCHSHMANKEIITFITQIFRTQFYGKFTGKAENDAHHHTIKNILYVFSRLIHESIVGQDILEHNVVPVFSQIELHNYSFNKNENCANNNNNIDTSIYSKDISLIVKKLNESVAQRSIIHYDQNHEQNLSKPSSDKKKLLESYV